MPRFFPSALRQPLGGTRQSRLAPALLAPALLTPALALLMPALAQAAPANTAPAEIVQSVSQLDAAANARDLQKVMQFYGSNFSHGDGLDRPTFERSIVNFWQPFTNIAYRTELASWDRTNSGLLAETVTTITGTQKIGDREFQLTSTLRSRQRFENQKIVRQDILSEQTQITTGTTPPTIKLNLPEQVRPGDEFVFDAVVQEPLGDDFLLGTAVDEPIQPQAVRNPVNFDLELLAGGGLFKVGRAPATAQSRWLSAVVIRKNGMTLVTRRLTVLGRR
jgi:hypothetical protein